mgnify:CR=1 FL=1|tara:strand:+ start:10572 stop:11624 length:1053 start_codon:yes stop_codon:yes gene_type:complete
MAIKKKLKIGNITIDNNNPFIIAEIGHNHQGNTKRAKDLILAAKKAGASAVKLQKRNNKTLFTKKFYNSPYDNPNSFAKTYGSHRDFLELSKNQFKELVNYSKKIKIELFATPFDIESVKFLENMNVKCYKIASADLRNTVLQKEVAKTKKPIFLSTGGGTLKDVKRAVKNITSINKDLSILHCTASYPCNIKDMNLNVISTYLKEFPKNLIGISDHENGIDAASIAYMLGARVFEKHFTLNRADKGTDNAYSLEPQGLEKLIRNIKRIPSMLGSKEKKILNSEKEPIRKMSKSIVAKKMILKDKIINNNDITIKSPGGGLDPYKLNEIIGKKAKKLIYVDDIILLKDVK